MAITTKERTELRQELVGQGYSWKYIDEWQPKVTLYRPRALTTPSGETVSPVGTALVNLPGNPDYVSRKARLGLLPWKPSTNCDCRWCAKNRPEQEVTSVAESISNPPESSQEPKARPSFRLGPYFQQETS